MPAAIPVLDSLALTGEAVMEEALAGLDDQTIRALSQQLLTIKTNLKACQKPAALSHENGDDHD